MKRRQFIKATGTAAITAPFILPSGRLFATTGNPPLAEHVVFVLFAGGVRQQEAMEQRYLSGAQNLDIPGNILYNMLPGEPPETKIVYGTVSADGAPGGQPIAPLLQTTLSEQGTLFPEVRINVGGTGHYGGLVRGVCGNVGATQGLRQRPTNPTIFEYARRFLGLDATDVWFVGNGIGNSTPLLNHSVHPDFGPRYGANFFAPRITFGDRGTDHLQGFKIYHPEEQLEPIREMRAFLNHNFIQSNGELPHLWNTDDEKDRIKEFAQQTFDRRDAGELFMPPVVDNGDLLTVGYATEVLRYFQPKLTVINMSAVDTCHDSYTGYLQALHRADHALGFLWKTIQEQIPEMANNTVLLAMPEHGRNLDPNGILDENDWLAFDHDGDLNSRRMFALMAGPNVPANLTLGGPDNPIGTACDLMPTIAEIMGMKQEVQNAGFLAGSGMSLFDRI